MAVQFVIVDYDRIYGAWWERVIESNAAPVVAESVARYVGAINDTFPNSG